MKSSPRALALTMGCQHSTGRWIGRGTSVSSRNQFRTISRQSRLPTTEPAFRIDTVRSNNFGGGDSAGLPAEAGYPHLTVPMGTVHGLPVGLSFIGPAWSDARMLALGYAFEQATHARKIPNFLPSLEGETQSAFAPVH